MLMMQVFAKCCTKIKLKTKTKQNKVAAAAGKRERGASLARAEMAPHARSSAFAGLACWARQCGQLLLLLAVLQHKMMYNKM